MMEGCLARVQAVMDDTLSDARDVEAVWSRIDEIVIPRMQSSDCDLMLRPTGTALNVNEAGRARLVKLLVAVGLPYEGADSMASAIVDWQDEDDDALPNGAEQGWYRAAHRQPPRNGALMSRQELYLVRGCEILHRVDGLIDIEPGRILLTRAPGPVLATLPGLGPEAVARTLALQETGAISLQALAIALSPDARALLNGHLMELTRLVTTVPDAWIITVNVRRGSIGAKSSVEVLVVRGGDRVAIMRHRSSAWE
jgi:hypothetical protein